MENSIKFPIVEINESGVKIINSDYKVSNFTLEQFKQLIIDIKSGNYDFVFNNIETNVITG